MSDPLVTFTFVRHGESTDNLKSIWAGWKDAPLSNHGMNQAKEMGTSLRHIRFTAIHASPLKRAHWTAEALRDAQPDPKPPLTTSPLLREQHFGIAEGKPWVMEFLPGLTLEQHYERGVYPVLTGHNEKFPDGESTAELEARAGQAVEEIIMPYIQASMKSGERGIHVAIVSHGLCISQLIPALLRNDGTGDRDARHYRGLLNTAWAKAVVDLKSVDGGAQVLRIRVTEFNRHEHLDSVKRQSGGIGSAGYDPKQQDIRAFFGGAEVKSKPSEEGRSESNVRDEVDIEQS